MMRDVRQWKVWPGRIYAGLACLHRWIRSRKHAEALPVIVVGSLRAGGGGKTPVTMWLARQFPEAAVLAHPTGDEDQELQRAFPGRVFLGKAWQELWGRAHQAGFNTGICDGGFQDPGLDGAFKLLIWDEPKLWGYESLLPLGPFREVPDSISRADLVLEEKNSTESGAACRKWGFSWKIEPLLKTPRGEVLLACGVGRPTRVVQDLEAMGFRVKGSHIVSDHGGFSRKVVKALSLKHAGLPWIGTSKDAERWSESFPPLTVMKRVWNPEHPQALLDLLERELELRQRSEKRP
jgi:tetraacyldisaccharide 4'-kinase